MEGAAPVRSLHFVNIAPICLYMCWVDGRFLDMVRLRYKRIDINPIIYIYIVDYMCPVVYANNCKYTHDYFFGKKSY